MMPSFSKLFFQLTSYLLMLHQQVHFSALPHNVEITAQFYYYSVWRYQKPVKIDNKKTINPQNIISDFLYDCLDPLG